MKNSNQIKRNDYSKYTRYNNYNGIYYINKGVDYNQSKNNHIILKMNTI